MNGNFPFQLVSNVYDQLTVTQPVGFGVLSPQSIQYVPSATYPGLPDVNSGMCLPAQQSIIGNSTCTLINQGGVTYLVVTPVVNPLSTTIPCFQTELPLQGVQISQAINNATSGTSFVVQNSPFINPTAQCTLPMQSASVCPQFIAAPSVDMGTVQPLQPAVLNFNIKSEPVEQESQFLSQNLSEFGAKCSSSVLDNNQQHPVNTLTSFACTDNLPLASSTIIPGVQPCIQGDSNIGCVMDKLDDSNAETVGQTLNTSQSFHVLIPTSQGMAIQTVVANRLSQGALHRTPVALHASNLINLEQESLVHPHNLLNLPNPDLNSQQLSTVVNVSDVNTSVLSENTHEQASVVTSHNSAEIVAKNEQLETKEEEETVSAETQSISSPDSSYCLPDSTDDLGQPTIKQSSSSIVDGIDLEEIREFARTFKMRRLFLGLTQTQVGQALCATEGPAYSQSAICRFEKLDITPRSAMKIRPVLEKWLREAEAKYERGQVSPTGADLMHLSSAGKIRKRRTFFSAQALSVLNSRFDRNSHPSGREINSIAQDIGYDRDVVRVWFCNKRQSLRQSSSSQRGRINQKSS